MLTTGSWNRPANSVKMTRDIRAFTLIELTMVIVLAGFFVALTFPRFRTAVMQDNLKTTVRRMAAEIDRLRNDSLRNDKDYDLRFDLESNQYWIEDSGMSELERAEARENPSTLPEDLHIKDVRVVGMERRITGEARIRFFKKGYISPSFIHISSEDGREFTLVLRPFMNKVTIMKGYLEDYEL